MRSTVGDAAWPPDSLRTALLALLLVSAAALAGCGGPGADADRATDAAATATTAGAAGDSGPSTSQSAISSAGVDPEATWERTVRLLDADASRPSVVVRPRPGDRFEAPAVVTVFAGRPEAGEPPRGGGYYTSSNNTVVLYEPTVANASARHLESILVHEYVHAVQAQDDRFTRGSDGPPRDWLVLRAHREGMARYVQVAYERRHLNGSRDRDRRFDRLTTRERWVTAPYYYGMRYYDRRVDTPRALPRVVADPPASTAQLLHPGYDGWAPLSVNATESGGWRVTDADRTWGELGTRVVLRDELNETRSAAAAGGWANDVHVAFAAGRGNATGHVWVHRWDDPAEADEFERATGRFLDRRRTETDRYRFRFERLAPETTAVVAGRGGFVGNVTVAARSNESVTVSPPG